MSTVYLDASMVPSTLKGGYNGKKFRVVVTEQITIPAQAGVWDGGSRDTYSLVEIATGNQLPVSDTTSPWDRSRVDQPMTLRPGFVIVCHAVTCGVDMGLTFYVHPDSAAKLLPEGSVELTDVQKLVLEATASLKASYAGKDRYENSKPYGSMSEGERLERLAKVQALYDAKGNVMLKSGKMALDRITELKGWTNFFPSREEWETAKSELITMGLLNKAGAITNKGRNAR